MSLDCLSLEAMISSLGFGLRVGWPEMMMAELIYVWPNCMQAVAHID